jgi:hypothetical protein
MPELICIAMQPQQHSQHRRRKWHNCVPGTPFDSGGHFDARQKNLSVVSSLQRSDAEIPVVSLW